MNRKTSIIFLVCCVVIFAFMSFFGGSAKNDINIGDTSLSLSYKDFQTTVFYEDIRAVGLMELDDGGTVVDGGSNRTCDWGIWENQRFGEYTRYTAAATDNCVVLELKNGDYVAFSFEGTETTVIMGETLYETLLSKGYELEELTE